MQVKNIPSIELFRIYPQLGNVIRILVSVACGYFIFRQFQQQSISFESVRFPEYFYIILLVQVALMFANWYLEIYRWKISIKPFEPISTKEAATDVLGGLALNWISPFTTGDLITRLAAKKDKYKTASAVLMNRSIMLLLTLLTGSYGILMLAEFSLAYDYILLFFGVVLALLFFFRNYTRRFLPYFFDLNRRLVSGILVVSVFRYFIFLAQFIILLKIFLPEIDWLTLAGGVGWIFFIRSSVPSLFGGVGLREASAFFFFEGLVTDMGLVILPVFIMWVINIVLPSAVGLILIWKLRFKIA